MSSPRARSVLVAAVLALGCSTEILAFDSVRAGGGRGGSITVGGGPGAGGGGDAGEDTIAVSGSGGSSGGPGADPGGDGGSAPSGSVTRLTVSGDGMEASTGTVGAALSGDGRFVAFSTLADNLVPGDTNGESDVFVRELGTDSIWCESQVTGPGTPSGRSSHPSLSHDGRDLVFASLATDLGASGVAGEYVLLHRTFEGGTLETVGSAELDCAGGALGNGGEVVFCTSDALAPEDSNGVADVYVRTGPGAFELVSETPGGVAGNGRSGAPAVSADGNVVVFESDASDLVPDDTNDQTDVFAYDRARGTLVRVSVASDGTEGLGPSSLPGVSADGLRVAFTSSADQLVPGDANAASDVFVHQLSTGETVRASVGNQGEESDGASYGASLDGTGRLVVFTSFARNFDPDCSKPTGVFVRDLSTSLTYCVSRVYAPSLDDQSSDGVISDDGRVVVYSSYSPSLVTLDTNLAPDVFAFRFRTAPWL